MIRDNRKIFPLLVILGMLFTVSTLHAEMKITLKDGKVINVPVKKEDVQSVEFGSESGKTEKVLAEKTIRIQSAKYGNVSFELGNELGYKQYFCNAGPALIKKCNGHDKCKIIVGSTICGDPYPGRGKYLYVEYTCGNKLKRAKNTQTEVMVLKCP
ncbi:hypothetical protein [Maridesulfovibrio sp.]|uniref:hypothetical protein n=1 Tax=Maridesulfovibrio sp. TaxID=2795000 RepID=UPI002A18AEA6|nr:hypothetical protein [Maridesulfovibrio sp.]